MSNPGGCPPRPGEYVKARVPGHDAPQLVIVLRRYTADGTFRLMGQDGQEYDGIPLSDIVADTIAPPSIHAQAREDARQVWRAAVGGGPA